MTRVHRIALGYLIIVCFGASTSMCGPHASAASHSAALSHGIAMVSANEGALWNLRDVNLICQVTMGSASTHERRLRWLRGHSGRVMGDKPCKAGNCRWTRNLTRHANALPANIASGKGGPKDWDAYWRVELAPRWQAIMDLADRCVLGELEKPCHLTPTTWDGRRWIHKAVMAGWMPVGCRGTLNEGFRRMAFRW